MGQDAGEARRLRNHPRAAHGIVGSDCRRPEDDLPNWAEPRGGSPRVAGRANYSTISGQDGQNHVQGTVHVKAFTATTSGGGEIRLKQLHAEWHSRSTYKKVC
jgi:hypothetical protein